MKQVKAIALGVMVALGVTSAQVATAEESDAIKQAVSNNPDRQAGDADRDGARHPAELMAFLELTPDMTIAEVNPGGGWYSRILAPFVRDNGRYIGLEHHPELYENQWPNYAAGLRAFPGKEEENTALYGEQAIGAWLPAKASPGIEAGSVDVVIAVRALHNWIRAGFFDEASDEVWQMLKMGGTFGIVQHRVEEDFDSSFEDTVGRGRWKQSEMIKAIEAKGFELVAASEMNANPRDTNNYPQGVWTLPPVYALGDEDREKYAAIGESDRMTLKFRKVAR